MRLKKSLLSHHHIMWLQWSEKELEKKMYKIIYHCHHVATSISHDLLSWCITNANLQWWFNTYHGCMIKRQAMSSPWASKSRNYWRTCCYRNESFTISKRWKESMQSYMSTATWSFHGSKSQRKHNCSLLARAMHRSKTSLHAVYLIVFYGYKARKRMNK